MSEISNKTCFWGSQDELGKLEKFIKDNHMYYDEKPENKGNVLIANIMDPQNAHEKIAQKFPKVAFVGYQVYYNCGEYDFAYSPKGDTDVSYVTPYSYEDDDDPYFDEDEPESEPEEPEPTWYEEIIDAVGMRGIETLFDLCQRDSDVDKDIFNGIPGFERN